MELYEAITVPATAAGVKLGDGLAAQLVSEATDQLGSLPLLQFTLAELFDQRQGDTIGLVDYRALGGLAGCINRRGARSTPR